MMSPNRKAALKATAAILQRKADRALQFWGVRSALLSEEIKVPPHPDFIQYVKPLRKGQRYATPAEISILRAKGNAAIRMNDLFRVTNREFSWLLSVAPSNVTRWCRTLDYPADMWWSDPDRPVDARPSSIKENWNSARSLTLAGSTDHEQTQIEEIAEEMRADEESAADPTEHDNAGLDPQSGEDGDSATEGVVARNQGEREELAEEIDLDRPGSVFGEDYWTDTEYPVLESQASFMSRGSNDDLDDLYGEEPRDERDQVLMRLIKGRGWRASRIEEAFQEASCKGFSPAGHFMPSNALPELFGDEQPAPQFNEEGKLVRGFFINRSEFFAQRDARLEALTWEYDPKPTKRRSPGPLDLDLIRKADAAFRASLPGAPIKPRLQRGQKWVGVIRGEIVKPSELCAPSE